MRYEISCTLKPFPYLSCGVFGFGAIPMYTNTPPCLWFNRGVIHRTNMHGAVGVIMEKNYTLGPEKLFCWGGKHAKHTLHHWAEVQPSLGLPLSRRTGRTQSLAQRGSRVNKTLWRWPFHVCTWNWVWARLGPFLTEIEDSSCWFSGFDQVLDS